MVESDRVRSWIFRHRLRLRAIYSPRLVPDRLPRPKRTAGPGSGQSEQEPGVIRREGTSLVLHPMAPPAA